MMSALERVDKADNARVKQQRLDLEDFILCLIEATARVSELRNLTVGQVRVVKPKEKASDPYAVLQIRGKTGHRTVIAGGLFPDSFERRAKGLKPGDRIGPSLAA
jgi:hypothetical protein